MNLTTGALTIDPGVHIQINVSGNSVLKLNPGVYVIEGGGFDVSGNATVSGTDVMIYNAGTDYLGSTKSGGQVSFSGQAMVDSAQPRPDHTRGPSLWRSRWQTKQAFQDLADRGCQWPN